MGTFQRILRIALYLAVGFVVYETIRVLAWTNRHEVIPGKVYRCSQPSGKRPCVFTAISA